jgi:hypothetical protein
MLCDEGLRRVAAEGLDHHVAGLARPGPGQHLHAGRALRCHPAQRRGIVDDQAHDLPAYRQCTRQPPAHTGIAVVVDHAAEDVPLLAGHGRLSKPVKITCDE